MIIRRAHPEDTAAITALLDQLGYPGTESFLRDRIALLADDPEEELTVGEKEGKVVAVLSLHFIPQLGVAGPFARISYFCVDQEFRGKGLGRQLEEYADAIARSRGCDRLEVHCHSRRTDAHRFYGGRGYQESPRYLVKKLG